MIDHARRLAEHLTQALTSGHTPLVIGGDCSLLIGTGLALSRRGGSGLVHIDGHTDFRHPGNSDQCASVAGEDLAAAIGLHWPAIADIDEAGPYFDPASAVHIGCREDDADMAEVRSRIGLVLPAREAVGRGMREAAEAARAVAGGSGYWIQLDVDVLDPTMMPAVDSPTPGGLSPDQLVALLQALAPSAIGASVTVFDPDLDPDGSSARLLTEVLSTGLEHLGSRAG